MKELNLHLSVNETNTVLRALSTLPYSQVHELIAKIQMQAREQLNEGNGLVHAAQTEQNNN
jgi:hypothetical protein